MHIESYFSHDAAAWVEIFCAVIMLTAPVGLLVWAWLTDKDYLGTGVIYFLAISEIIPSIVILGLQQVLDKAAAGTLLAGVAGYVLGGMNDNRVRPNPQKPGGDPQDQSEKISPPDTGPPDPELSAAVTRASGGRGGEGGFRMPHVPMAPMD